MIKLIVICTFLFAAQAIAKGNSNEVPPFLYKILTKREWEESQSGRYVKLPASDAAFIHLAEEGQISKIVQKFYGSEPEVVILKLDVKQLEGRLIKEANPGGSTLYYHLYNGAIPMTAIIETQSHRGGQGID